MQGRAGDQWRLYRQDGKTLTLIRDFDSLCEAAQCIASIEQLTRKVLKFEMRVRLDLLEAGMEPFQLSCTCKRTRFVVEKL